MRLLNIALANPIVHSNVRIEEYGDTIRMNLGSGIYVDDDIKYINILCPELTTESYGSILVGGLVLGLIPFYIQENKTFNKLTVIEKDVNIINAINDLGILTEAVEIIHDDFATYIPTQNYDLIISDYHWGHPVLEPNWETEIEDFKTKFTQYLNPGGTLLIPLSKYKITI